MKKQFSSKKQVRYWLSRKTQARLVKSERRGRRLIVKVTDIYQDALKNINRQITALYTKYANKVGISVDDLSLIINGSDKAKFLLSIRENMRQMGFEISEVYRPEYLARLSRLDALKEQIYWEIATISQKEIEASERDYRDIIGTSYTNFQLDMKSAGVIPSFSTLDVPVVNKILETRWLKNTFKTRIGKNVDKFAREIPKILGSALSTGVSSQITTRLIAKRFDVAIYNSARLVRTETNYFHNQAELQAMEDDGIKRYQFDAVMDGATSNVCEDHNGKVYNVKDAVVGENYPPLHPNCRSVPLSLFPNETSYIRKRPVKQ